MILTSFKGATGNTSIQGVFLVILVFLWGLLGSWMRKMVFLDVERVEEAAD